MKKITSVLLLILALSLLFAGCSNKEEENTKEPFNKEKSIEALIDNGLSIYEEYKTKDELEFISSTVNLDIYRFGGEFSIELTDYTSLIQYGNMRNECRFFEFVSEEQAQQYAEFFMGARTQDGEWLVGIDGKVVVVTNLSIAKDHINLEFK